ncbi:MAG: tryptophanase [Candidatus Binatia bacterium]
MKDKSGGISVSVPYEIAAIRPLRETNVREREEALKKAHFNTELIPQDMVYVDLKSDSGVSPLITPQVAAMIGVGALEGAPELAREVHGGLALLSKHFQEIFGYPFVVPCTQGRAAERIWTRTCIRDGSVVPGNMLFPSTRFHIESSGAKVVEVISEKAYELFSDDPFKGNVDVEKLEAVVKENGREKVACVYVELCVNSCGGHPVSMANLREIKRYLQRHGIPLFLDASRILENSYFIQRREEGYRSRAIRAIVLETCSHADACTLSAQKDLMVREGGFIGIRDEKSYQRAYFQAFLDGAQPSRPALAGLEVSLRELLQSDRYAAGREEQVIHLWTKLADKGVPVLHPPGGHGVFIDARAFLPVVPPQSHPAEALAAYIYSVSGVRATKGPPLTHSQTARGIELLRLAVPAHRYLQGHMDDVADAVLFAFSHRGEIRGLKRIEREGRSKYDPPLFTPLES